MNLKEAIRRIPLVRRLRGGRGGSSQAPTLTKHGPEGIK
jgi:hypothetical protein